MAASDRACSVRPVLCKCNRSMPRVYGSRPGLYSIKAFICTGAYAHGMYEYAQSHFQPLTVNGPGHTTGRTPALAARDETTSGKLNTGVVRGQLRIWPAGDAPALRPISACISPSNSVAETDSFLLSGGGVGPRGQSAGQRHGARRSSSTQRRPISARRGPPESGAWS